MNLPNALTLSRIFLVPLLLAVLLTKNVPNKEILAIVIVLVAATTDWLDGYLARRWGEVTTLGMLLDPIADKLLVSAAFISMVEMRLISAWMVVIIVGREFAVSGLRSIAQAAGFTIEASELAKVKTALQLAAIVTLLLGVRFEPLRPVATVLLWMVVFFAVVSAVGYFRKFWQKVDVRIKQRRSRLLLLRQRRRRAKGDVAAS